jgi:hypothetical protein
MTRLRSLNAVATISVLLWVTAAATPDADGGELLRGPAETVAVRFIRLEYDGKGWDDGLDPESKADVNFLREFERLSRLKAAKLSESHAIRRLSQYAEGQAPPFVYMTGADKIAIPAQDMKVLREYLLGGGMLFADCGSPRWHASFRGFAKALFPDKPLVAIANDDPIFVAPFAFPNGAPPLWHHGGHRALGIKHEGRWCVFYHPGDMNDAWKTGHSGLEADVARDAHKLGVNVIYYSFTHYLDMTRKYRK